MNYKNIIVGVIVFIILMWLYRYLFNDETKTNLLDGPSKADTNTMVPYTKLSGNASSTDFTYSTWIYVNNWNTKHGKDKIILQRKSNDGNFSPQIKLDPYKNDLTINTSYSGGAGGPNGTSQSSNQTCKINNIPLQKWIHILITINNRALDTYIDGKLVKTCIIEGPPTVSGTANIDICPANNNVDEAGFDGFIAKVRYYSRALNPREVYELYKEGYSKSMLGNLFNRYKLRFSYIKDNEEVGNIEL
tara:strand:+ start:2488 stop:3228 length:741 start_codon:yes stop_codon:yes gene_type:complete